MVSSVAPRPRVSLHEYLALEAAASERHILWNGEVFPVVDMAGGTPDHNTICANVITELNLALRGKGCRVMTSDQKVWIPRTRGVVYPDVTTVRGRIALLPDTTEVVSNPTLIVEVLSPETEAFDRDEKFEGYRSIASLRHYLMVSSQRVIVEHYTRVEDGGWLMHAYGVGESITIHSPDVTLKVDDLYRLAFESDAG